MNKHSSLTIRKLKDVMILLWGLLLGLLVAYVVELLHI